MGSSNDCTPEQDEIVREFCRENDVGQMQRCPKCGFKAGDPLHIFCQHKYCPFREWRYEQERPEREAREAAAKDAAERAEFERLKKKFSTEQQ